MARFPSTDGAYRGSLHPSFYAALALYAAVFLIYAETRAFTSDEGYHLLAAQLIASGKIPYIDFCFPQTPLNAYWNAAWIRLLGSGWRLPHLFAALFTIGAVFLTADYVARRFPVSEWRTAAAIVAAVIFGLNGAVFAFGPLQAYGICLLALAAAFRLATLAVGRDAWLPSAAAGFFSGVAAASSLLSAAAAPVLLLWIVFCNRAGSRPKKCAAFLFAMLLPCAPLLWLFARAPRQTWFNVAQYHAFFRKLYWPETTRHDLEILTSWIDNGQALLLILLSLSGLLYIVRRSAWPSTLKSEFYLCAWLAAALAAAVGRAHPTFARYFLLTVPFLAILSVAGLFALSRAFEPIRAMWPALAVIALAILGWGKTMYDRRELETWASYQRLAAKVDEVTPPNSSLLAVEPIYFLTRRTPPPGYELSYTHLVELPPPDAALMHILDSAEVKRQVQSGMFATVYTCSDEEIAAYGLSSLYRQHVELDGCAVYWDRKNPVAPEALELY